MYYYKDQARLEKKFGFKSQLSAGEIWANQTKILLEQGIDVDGGAYIGGVHRVQDHYRVEVYDANHHFILDFNLNASQ